jgi:hypothetical protein
MHFFHIHASCPANITLLKLIILIISDDGYKIIKLLITQCSQAPTHPYSIPLSSKYSLQHPVLEDWSLVFPSV